MKLSVYNPTGSRAVVHGTGKFAGITVRSLFATRGLQVFDVASQEHADWLTRHIKASIPSVQIKVIGDAVAQEAPAVEVAPVQELAPVAEPEVKPETAAEEPAKPAKPAHKKSTSRKSQTVTETKE